MASETRHKSGLLPMAARSDRLRAKALWPTSAARCVSRRKCVPSRTKSVVKTRSCFGLGRRIAQSSPIPRIRPLLDSVRRASFRIRSTTAVSRMGEVTELALLQAPTLREVFPQKSGCSTPHRFRRQAPGAGKQLVESSREHVGLSRVQLGKDRAPYHLFVDRSALKPLKPTACEANGAALQPIG